MSESALRVVELLPELLGTYGDHGNALVLAHRARQRGVAAEVVPVATGRPVPTSGDVYLLGGGEDAAQVAATRELAGPAGLAAVVAADRPVLAVCAGLQLLGRSFTGPDGAPTPGLGLVDVTTTRLGRRAVGEIVVDADPDLGLPALTGFENHGGATRLGPGVAPLGRVRYGVGNGAGGRLEGYLAGRVVATYLHGPVLARNPALADLLLRWAGLPTPPLPWPLVERLRADRIAAAPGSVRTHARLARARERAAGRRTSR